VFSLYLKSTSICCTFAGLTILVTKSPPSNFISFCFRVSNWTEERFSRHDLVITSFIVELAIGLLFFDDDGVVIN
jgi:hypothetical protein